jgi:hypothetical protein
LHAAAWIGRRFAFDVSPRFAVPPSGRSAEAEPRRPSLAGTMRRIGGSMRRVLFVLLILNGLLLPLCCVPVLFLINAVNPMQLAFITGFTVENRTAEVLYVTPIGTVGPAGERHPLPMALWKVPWVPASERAKIPVQSAEKITLYYDWDDINFSELVIETPSGELRQLVVNANPTANQYTKPPVSDFVIDDFGRLEAADQRVRAAYTAAQIPSRFGRFLLGSAIPGVTFCLLLWCYKRLKRLPV